MEWGDILKVKDDHNYNPVRNSPDYYMFVGASKQRPEEITVLPFGYKRTKRTTREKFEVVDDMDGLNL